eukprot:Filipodium_phascolosomae@DN1219_c0_g1_i1.p1
MDGRKLRSMSLPSGRPDPVVTGSFLQSDDVLAKAKGMYNDNLARGVRRSLSTASEIVEKNQTQIPFWLVTGVLVLLVYHMFSDGDYSFMLTVGSLVSSLSFLLVLTKIVQTTNFSGVSLEMMKCYSLLSCARLTSILFFDSYLPFDRSGDLIYRIGEILNCSLAIALVVAGCLLPRFQQTVATEDDVVKFHYLAIPAALVAVLIHPSLNNFILTDMAWAFALYLECVAVLPQLFLFNKQKTVEVATTHFLAAQALSRLLSFTFWFWTWHELNDANHVFTLKQYVGQWTLFMQAAQLIVLGDFIYSYVKAIVTGTSLEKMLLPSPGV